MGCKRKDLCVNYSKSINEYAERCPRGHWFFLRRRSEKKRCGTYDSKPDRSWNRNCRENAAELRRIRSSDFLLYQCLGDENKEAKEERHQYTSMQYAKYLVASPDGHLRQSAQSLRSSSGYD